ncbi:DNA adenine methylase [Cupriavidus sp. WGlv3]|uniref:DNA adenine methylase n=1 Tax=Cupriavidus sp. WGlv3 TaxID=2919924 RepID=UPI0020912E79|nr:DNA adenine methylase [Cupriavidus sp. WGlv3]
MEKYIGNKTAILPLLHNFIVERAPRAGSISDLFAGTTNVSRYFRARDFDVALGDINRFSYVLGQVYVGLREYPRFEVTAKRRVEEIRMERIHIEFLRGAKRASGAYLPSHVSASDLWRSLLPLARTLAYLQSLGEANAKPGPITEYFTQWGERACFVSQRGTAGKRNYFSRENALFLDAVLPTIRRWWQKGELSLTEAFLLMTSILEEITITANVNGTFHDFNRNRIWPNAQQDFFLRLPITFASKGRFEAANNDALPFSSVVGPHDVCYIDPPYNFRQYTAYYHLLNFVAAFPFMEELAGYLSKLEYVRGQQPEDDYSSDFCYKDRFVTSLRSLFDNVDSRYVVLSYYSGRNHWNHWSKVDKPTDQGLRELRAIFEDRTIFSDCEVVPALDVRRNYQSRVGEQKQLVNEYLFWGVKKRAMRKKAVDLSALGANRRFGLDDIFKHVISPRDKLQDSIVAFASGEA